MRKIKKLKKFCSITIIILCIITKTLHASTFNLSKNEIKHPIHSQQDLLQTIQKLTKELNEEKAKNDMLIKQLYKEKNNTIQFIKTTRNQKYQLQKDNQQLKQAFKTKNLASLDLTNQNFSGCDFSHFNLQNANLTNATLPQTLANANLKNANFTACKFKYTNLQETDFNGTILTNTICDYRVYFRYKAQENTLYGGTWYRQNLYTDIKNIARVYPQLTKDKEKAICLHISSGITHLTEDNIYPDFYINVAYWSCKLLRLICSLEKN